MLLLLAAAIAASRFVPSSSSPCTLVTEDAIRCEGGSPEDSLPTLLNPRILSLSISNCDEAEFHLSILENATRLRHLQLTHCNLATLIVPPTLPPLVSLDLSENRLANHEQVCALLRSLPRLRSLSLASNRLSQFPHCPDSSNRLLIHLNLTHNLLTNFSARLPVLESLDLSSNRLTVTPLLPSSLAHVNLSRNHLAVIAITRAPQLLSLILDANPLTELRLHDVPRLRVLRMRESLVRVLDLNQLNQDSLAELDLASSSHLSTVLGTLPPRVHTFTLSDSRVRSLPSDFFARSSRDLRVDLDANNWDCDACLSRWTVPLNSTPSICANHSRPALVDCSLGIAPLSHPIVRAVVGTNTVLQCGEYGSPRPTVRWTSRDQLIGEWNPQRQIATTNWTRDGAYRVLPGGALLITGASRSLVERYRCDVFNTHGNKSLVIFFRLDLSAWYSLDVFDSVFVGSCICAILVCLASFIANLLWIVFRNTILWWIKRAERMSRVRKMVEAMEKYRARQMDHLHERYQSRMENVRESYRQQVEQLRQSYVSQAERFRDYRAAQIENVTQHLDSIRDNYNQQLSRMREYGARRAENLWESYERQVNRMKTFSLQHRLKLMRQYKVKQRYLNKLLDALNQDQHDPVDLISKQHSEAAVLAALGESVESAITPQMPSRAASFYSLPEYLLEEDDVIRRESPSSSSRSQPSRHRTNEVSRIAQSLHETDL